MLIKTLNGETIDTGFWGPDTSKIQLGELPLMATQQFVGYAALTLSNEIIPHLEPARRTEWAPDAQQLYDRVKDLPIQRITGKYFGEGMGNLMGRILSEETNEEDRGEAWSVLSQQAAPTGEALFYRENPFVVNSSGERVGFKHEGTIKHVITSEDFFNLAHTVIGGGIMGWGKYGTYQEVKDAAAKINRALNPNAGRELERPPAVEITQNHSSLQASVQGDRLVIGEVKVEKGWDNPMTYRLLMLEAVTQAGRLGMQVIDGAFNNNMAAGAFAQSFERGGYSVEYYDGEPDQGGQRLAPNSAHVISATSMTSHQPEGEQQGQALHIRAHKPHAADPQS